MKEIIIKVALTVTKVAAIYVVLMSAMVTGALGLAIPELGFGILVVSGLLLIAVEILGIGGNGNGSGRNGA